LDHHWRESKKKKVEGKERKRRKYTKIKIKNEKRRK